MHISKCPDYRAGNFFFIIFSLLFCCLLLLASCGKKGDPTLKSYEKPEPPSDLSAIHRESELILFWNFPKDKELTIKGFRVMKSSGGDFEKIAFVDRDKRSYADANITDGCEYQYKIVTQNLRGILSKDSKTISTLPLYTPHPPEKFSYRIDDSSIILFWERSENTIIYNVYKSEIESTYGLLPINHEPIKEHYFKDTLNIHRTVYYTVRSLIGSEIRDEGPASEELKVDPREFIPSEPENLQALAREENVYLIWEEPPEIWVTGYRIYRKADKQEFFELIGETQTPAFVDRDKSAIKKDYRITAIGPAKEGPPAEIRGIISLTDR